MYYNTSVKLSSKIQSLGTRKSSFSVYPQLKILKIGELFSGAGGLALGSHLANDYNSNLQIQFRTSWAIDNFKPACDTYQENIFKYYRGKVINADIQNVDFKALKQVDILSFGFPCNDFSIVGEKKGLKGRYGPLYRYSVYAINHFRPTCFVAENVPGLASANKYTAMAKIIKEFTDAGDGYLLSVHKYKSEEYGVPQKRHRIIIVGFSRKSGLLFRPPSITHKKPVTAEIALSDIFDHAYNHQIRLPSEIVRKRLELIPPGGNAWTIELPDYLRIKTKTKISQIYRKLKPNEPSYTVTGSGGGGTHMYHWSEPRALTNRERARLQSFPDDFIFSGSKEDVRKQIGMAVPPLLSRSIFSSLLKTIAGVKYDYVEDNIYIDRSLF